MNWKLFFEIGLGVLSISGGALLIAAGIAEPESSISLLRIIVGIGLIAILFISIFGHFSF